MRPIHSAILAACTFACVGQTMQAQNTIYGSGAGGSSGNGNSVFGGSALTADTSGSGNTAVGAQNLRNNTTGTGNTAIGVFAIGGNTTGNQNTASGVDAMESNSTGSNNTAAGFDALYSNTTGSYNIAFGYQAGYNNPASTSYNIDIGSAGSSSDSGTIRIGTASNETSFFAAGIDGVAISSGVEVFINSSGQLGTVNSSARFKEDVHDMADASSKLLQLRPVTYRYKQPYADGTKPLDYGLIAEEVAQVYPDLVAHDAKGDIQTVQYQKLTPMLLNEVQKQQHEMNVQRHEMDVQQKTIEMLEQRLSALETAAPSTAVKLQGSLQ